MTVTVVLDTSALLAYVKGSVAVGELLSIVSDDGDRALVPATCLAAAHRASTPDGSPPEGSAPEGSTPEGSAPENEGLLGVLSALACVTQAGLSPDQAPQVGMLARQGGVTIDASHAAVEAVRNGAQLVTQQPAAAGRLLPAGWPIIEV